MKHPNTTNHLVGSLVKRWETSRQALYGIWTYASSYRSHPRKVRKGWKRIGRISGTLECSAHWLSPPWCYIINLIQGMLLSSYLLNIELWHLNVIPVYKLGHSRKLKNEWKPVARNINMNPNHHPLHDQYIPGLIFYETCLEVQINKIFELTYGYPGKPKEKNIQMVSAYFKELQHSIFVSLLVLLQIHQFVHLGIPLVVAGSIMF